MPQLRAQGTSKLCEGSSDHMRTALADRAARLRRPDQHDVGVAPEVEVQGAVQRQRAHRVLQLRERQRRARGHHLHAGGRQDRVARRVAPRAIVQHHLPAQRCWFVHTAQRHKVIASRAASRPGLLSSTTCQHRAVDHHSTPGAGRAWVAHAEVFKGIKVTGLSAPRAVIQHHLEHRAAELICSLSNCFCAI